MFRDTPDLPTLCRTPEAMKIHPSLNGVSTVAIPTIGRRLNQMALAQVVKILRDIFAYADIQIVVCTVEKNGVEKMSDEGDAEFYADNKIVRYSEEFYHGSHEVESEFTADPKSCQPSCDEQFSVLPEK